MIGLLKELCTVECGYWDTPFALCRTKSCIFGNETCFDDYDEEIEDVVVYGLQHEPLCNGPSTKVCPLAAGSDFGDFKQFDIGGDSRSLRCFIMLGH